MAAETTRSKMTLRELAAAAGLTIQPGQARLELTKCPECSGEGAYVAQVGEKLTAKCPGCGKRWRSDEIDVLAEKLGEACTQIASEGFAGEEAGTPVGPEIVEVEVIEPDAAENGVSPETELAGEQYHQAPEAPGAPPEPERTPGPEPRPNPEDIGRLLDLVMVDDGIVEIRALNVPRRGTVTGYFDRAHLEQAVKAAASLSGRASGVYFTLNPVDSSLLARAQNRLRDHAPRGESTKDEHVVRRRLLGLDFDYDRPAGISTTDEEHAAAVARCRECVEALEAEGIVPVLMGDSGNGGHALLAVDLPNDADSLKLVERLYKAMAHRFGLSPIKFDTANSNASRIWKLYGTLSAKGDHTAGRPHRLSRILALRTESDHFEDLIVTRERLEALANKWAPSEQPKEQPKRSERSRRPLSAAEVLDALTYIRNVDDRTTWLHVGMALKSEFGEEGREFWDGWSRVSTKFNSADQDKTWESFKPDGGVTIATLFKLAQDAGWSRPARELTVIRGSENGRPPSKVAENEMPTAAAVLADHRKRISKPVIWKGILLAGSFNMLLGRPFSGKSSFAAALTLAIHRGNLFLGRPCTKSKVAYFALERSGIGVAELFEKWRVAEEILYESEIPVAEAVAHIETRIRQYKLQFVVVDHLQHAARIQKGNDYADVANALKPFQEIAARTGCCILVLHHQRKPQPGENENNASGESDEIEALGTDAYRAASETLIECSKSRGLYYLRGQTRGLSDLTRIRVLIDFETGEVEVGDPQQEQRDQAGHDIELYLAEHPGSTEAAIKAGIKRKHRGIAISDALRNTGKFRREGQGGRFDPYRYFVADGQLPGVSGKDARKGVQVLDSKGKSSIPNAGNGREQRERRELQEPDQSGGADLNFTVPEDSIPSAVPAIPTNSREPGTDKSLGISNTYRPNSASIPEHWKSSPPNDPAKQQENRELRETRERNPEKGDPDDGVVI